MLWIWVVGMLVMAAFLTKDLSTFPKDRWRKALIILDAVALTIFIYQTLTTLL